MNNFDTIVGISTAIGGGIAIIRISGKKSKEILFKIFKGKKNNEIENRKIKYGHIFDEKGERIDEVLVTYMKSPNSYTCEDIIEINCHGGSVVTNMILKEILKEGARLAQPGEFTKRAFLNGRINLSEAQGVMDIINAKTETALKYGIYQLGGELNNTVVNVRKKILKMIAQIEVTVDYPEEDIEELTAENIIKMIDKLINELGQIENKFNKGKILREGISVIIVGKPNVGKSSLLNKLLMEEKAIVTNIPGTTRDIVEEYINIEGIPIKFIDTAGIREVDDAVEKIGIKKTFEKLELADLIIYVIDMNEEIDEEDKDILNKIENRSNIILLNKIDEVNREYDYLEKFKNVLKISTLENKGIEELKQCIIDMINNGDIVVDSNELLSRLRIEEAVINSINKLNETKNTLKNMFAIDLATIDLKDAYIILGDITDENIDEDIVNKIFSEFCVGK